MLPNTIDIVDVLAALYADSLTTFCFSFVNGDFNY